MRIGRVTTLTREDVLTLSILWPEALEMHERQGWRPPLDDYEVADNPGDLPEWVVDKYEVLRRIAPDDVGIDQPPAEFPVIEKRRINPEGLAVGARPYRVCYPRQDLPKGYLWQRRWYGYHYSIDVAVWNGWPSWQIVVQGLPAEGDGRFGQFAAWSIWPDSKRRGVESWGFRNGIASYGLEP